jgi:probable phosphoglycerate mutase
VPLDETGLAQAERGASLLAALMPDLIVSSPLQRAAATAEALARLTGLSVSYDDRLVERHGGSWEGLTDVDIRAGWPESTLAWQPPDGETEHAVGERAGAAMADVAHAIPAGGTAVVVSHGGALRAGIGRFLGLPNDWWWVLGPLNNCCWSVLGGVEGDERGWRLLEHNAGTLPEPVLSDDR